MRLPFSFTKAVGRVAELAMPRVCAACRAGISHDTPEALCAECWRDLAAVVGGVYCRTCGDDRGAGLLIDGKCTACRLGKTRPRFACFAKVGRFAGSLRQLVLRFKREFTLDHFLGRLLADAVRGRFDPASVDIWVPVPSHWRQRVSRGFQPTTLLARGAARHWRGRVESVLTVTRFVRPFHQRGVPLSAARRAAEIKGAFRLRRGVRLTGRTVCIIDDVSTTGATLQEARRALWAGGARRILAAVVAKTSALPVRDRTGGSPIGEAKSVTADGAPRILEILNP